MKITEIRRMTYGEYYYFLKYDMMYHPGIGCFGDLPKISVSKKMSRGDATSYYSAKFAKYWNSLDKH